MQGPADGKSADKIKKVVTHLGSLFADAVERGLAMRNPVRDRKKGKKPADRHAKRLEAGVDIPTPAEIRAIIDAASG